MFNLFPRRAAGRRGLRISHLRVEELEPRTAPTVNALSSFAGMNYGNAPGSVPPDTIAASGPTEIVETVNTSIAIYPKTGGAAIFQTDLGTFFSSVRTGNAFSDVYAGYNELTGQFFVSTLDLNIDPFFGTVDSDAFLYAISNKNNPTSGSDFTMYSVDLTGRDPAGASTFWADFPRVGWNNGAYVATFNMFTVFINTFAENYDHPLVLNISSSTPTTTTLADIPGGVTNATLAPATMHGASAGGPMLFVEETLDSLGNPTGNSIRVVTETNLFTTPTFTSTDVSLPSTADYTAPPSAAQNGSTTLIQTNDSRILNAEWRGNHLVAAQTIGVASDSQAHARWYEFDTSSTPTLIQDGTIGVGSGASSYFPSIAIGANDVLGLDYIESSATEYMSVYETGRLSTDATGQMETAVEAQAGQAVYTGFDGSPYRAGDFSGITVDPSDGTFWLANEYATADTTQPANWGTVIANFKISSSANPPTITSISANPNPVTGKTTVLSVTATDPNVGATITNYTWAVQTGPSGVTFDANNGGMNGATVTATFTQAGAYTFLVTVTDSLGGSATDTVAVTVQQTLTSIKVSPSTATVADGGTKQFSATAFDQFGIALATQPGFTWSVASGGAGTINSTTGLYTAPTSGTGTDTVQATNGVVIGTASITFAQVPTVTQAAAAKLAANGLTASLSVLATDPNPGGSIASYTWSVSGPSGVTFSSSNGTSTGNNTTANFTQTGKYTFTVTITNSFGISTTSSVQLVVGHVLTKITVSPASVTVRDGNRQQFTATAFDQFNKTMSAPISWKIVSGPSTGAGSISSTGLYTAPSSGTGTVMIEAFDGSVFATATITLVRKHH
jgi:hypothetical protein